MLEVLEKHCGIVPSAGKQFDRYIRRASDLTVFVNFAGILKWEKTKVFYPMAQEYPLRANRIQLSKAAPRLVNKKGWIGLDP